MLRWLAPACLVFVSGCAQAEPMTADRLEARLRADLPLGTSAEDVAAYLNANSLSSDGAVSVDQLRAVKEQPGHTDFLAILRDVRKTAVVSTSVQMRFVFDDQNRLTSTTIRELHTGP